jgi:GDP-4-dehydro-6-deoxy-D-mannose reductase
VKKILVTGASGFLGRHLVQYLKTKTMDVQVFASDCVEEPKGNTERYFKVDFTEESQVQKVVDEVMPDCIIHLAGLFDAADSVRVYQVNVLSLAVLLEAVRKKCPSTLILTAGSAAEYGTVSADYLPASELTPCTPVSLYGQTKFLATQIAQFYYRIYQLPIMVFRPFQLIGKGVSSKLAPGAFAEQLQSAAKQKEPVIKVGNLRSFRDFLDVADAAEAIWSLCCKPAPGQIFNICSGRFTQMSELLDQMIKILGINVRIEADPSRLKGNQDVSVIYGSNAKIRRHSGWQPRISLKQSIQNMLL